MAFWMGILIGWWVGVVSTALIVAFIIITMTPNKQVR